MSIKPMTIWINYDSYVKNGFEHSAITRYVSNKTELANLLSLLRRDPDITNLKWGYMEEGDQE